MLGCDYTDIIKSVLLIIIPFIIYKMLLMWLNNKYDIEMGKMERGMIFIIVDLLIFMLSNYFWK